RHLLGICDDELLQLVERVALAIARQVADLLRRDADCSADGRADVHSKRTADERAGLERGEGLELCVHALLGVTVREAGQQTRFLLRNAFDSCHRDSPTPSRRPTSAATREPRAAGR